MVPWISVYDFDERSRTDGLLSMLEDKIKCQRRLYTCTWKDLSQHSTQWCMIKGAIQEQTAKLQKMKRNGFNTSDKTLRGT